jgi:hypothetical protein
MKHSWKDKLDEQGRQIVEMAAKVSRIRLPATLDPVEWGRWTGEQKGVYSSHPDLEKKRKVALEPAFVRLLLRMHPEIELNETEMEELFEREEFPSLRAEELELHQRLFLVLESDQNRRFEVYATAASAIVLFRHLFRRALTRQFGTKKLGLLGLFGLIAQNLEWLAGTLRGKVRKPPGGEYADLAALIDALLEHQKEPLTQIELYEAVKASGAVVPDDPEAFRLWLHRARKKGSVKNYRSTQNE